MSHSRPPGSRIRRSWRAPTKRSLRHRGFDGTVVISILTESVGFSRVLSGIYRFITGSRTIVLLLWRLMGAGSLVFWACPYQLFWAYACREWISGHMTTMKTEISGSLWYGYAQNRE